MFFMDRKRLLIVNYCLSLGGAEKLVYEISKFALRNNIKPHVLIPNGLGDEYYDSVFKSKGIVVIRTEIDGFKKLLKRGAFKALFWNIFLRYFSKYYFSKVHFMSLLMAHRYFNVISHKQKVLWHIMNQVQYPNGRFFYNKNIFLNKEDILVYINKYQSQELRNQDYKITCKEVEFKLFLDCDES